MFLNQLYFCHRRVQAVYCKMLNDSQYFQVLNRSLETRTSQSSTPSTAPAPTEGLLPVALVPQHVITSGTAKDCVRLRGLPYEAQVSVFC